MEGRRGPDRRAILNFLTEGFRVSKWVSSLSVAGLVGVAGFVLALKDGRFRDFGLFSGKEDAENDSFLVPGLHNLGNNCFLNVILQALASCKDFRAYLQRVLEDSKASKDEHMPLTFALLSLLEELCMVKRGRTVSSPCKVMIELSGYVQNFDLTNQQDAAEALFHLISSLQEELTDRYIPRQSTLSDVITSLNLRILSPRNCNGFSELERWRKCFLGPFDGILGSVLMCQTCSSQISLEFQFFHTLPLAPVLDNGSDIMLGCTLEDCLKKFFVAEKVENYYCSKCWHSAALKYLSVRGAAETDIEKLRSCIGEDQCDCKTALRLETLPWSNNFSHTLKQLSIGRCPKLLCIQVQRASMNMFGESIKLRGHVRFPMDLDLSPFTTSEIGMKPEESKVRHTLESKKYNAAGVVLNLLKTSQESNAAPPDPEESKLLQSNEKIIEESSSKCNLYRLVTVVEHFGKSGSGHYTVYRKSQEEERKYGFENLNWFSISDSQVDRVLETDVLAAQASLLFYQRLF